jgi:alpha-L-rhamnosidase
VVTSNRSASQLLELARLASPDPFADHPIDHDSDLTWLYAPNQYELGTLERLVDVGFAANRHVHYAANYGRAEQSARYRLRLDPESTNLKLRASGHLQVSVEQSTVDVVTGDDGWVLVDLPRACDEVELRVASASGPAAVGLPGADLRLESWQVWADGWVQPKSGPER